MLLSVYYSDYLVNISCKYESKIIGAFSLIRILKNACFVCYPMGNGPVEGAITSILKH